MSTTEIIGKHDVLCSSLNFATPDGAAECDCNLSVMADMLEALEQAAKLMPLGTAIRAEWLTRTSAILAKARGIA